MTSIHSMDKNMTILVVDDFLTMRKIVKNNLKQLGFKNFTEAEDGQQALDKIKEQKFDFIISDWNMPKMMGIDLLKAVRSDANTKHIPFLMVTAEGKKENVIAAAQAGVSNYIVKPFTQDGLVAKIEGIFCK